VGIPSNGLHTNGYSLVRHALSLDDDPSPLREHYAELDGTLADALLAPHRSYYRELGPVFSLVKAAAHITGGGLPENMPRVLPEGLAARFDTTAWKLSPVFSVLQEMAEIEPAEMFRVFNMGLGMVLVCDKKAAAEVTSDIPDATVVGGVGTAEDERLVILE
jgi:phosphoribosylformylglycinamidine cyclo-ligase